jgi:hypothetical protein
LNWRKVKSEKIMHTFAMEVKISAKKKSENDIACIHQTNTKYSIQHTKAYMNKKMFNYQNRPESIFLSYAPFFWVSGAIVPCTIKVGCGSMCFPRLLHSQ